MRRKARKANERIADLKRREKRARAYLKVIAKNAETLQKLADAEASEEKGVTDLPSDASVQDDQSTQSTSE